VEEVVVVVGVGVAVVDDFVFRVVQGWPTVEEGRAFELVGPGLFELALAFPRSLG
jgi:hypothetical protein